MSLMDAITAWLYECPEIDNASRITPDMLDAEDMSLANLPQDEVTVYIDGRRDITKYMLFWVRQGMHTHAQRQDAQTFLETLERWIWQRNVARQLPQVQSGLQVQSVTISQAPYMLETDGQEAVYQIGLAINFIE